MMYVLKTFRKFPLCARQVCARHRTTVAIGCILVGLCLTGAPICPPAQAQPSPLEPASSGGIQALDRALVRLGTHKRLLVIAAHPDDEDTTLLTWVARGLGGEAAYLSLSRGDGGQNLIGPELGIGLGLLRSRELEAARQIDGARQFFTRAYDFGFTRSIEETLERWPKEILLEDAVRVVRRFKPQVLMTVFPPSARAGHGQHWASGIVAEEVFDLAADPEAFPHLLDQGLAPWKIEHFYRGAWWNPDAASLQFPLGVIEPFSGRSIFQIALASRSQHRCQDMGNIQPLGDATGRLTWVKSRNGQEPEGLFDGVETRLMGIASPLPEGSALRRAVEADLLRIAHLARDARSNLVPGKPAAAKEPLQRILHLLHSSRQRLLNHEREDPSPHEATRHVRQLVEEKLSIANEALANAAKVLVDAVTDREIIVPGDSVPVRSMFWNAGHSKVEEAAIEVVAGPGWEITSNQPAKPNVSRFATKLTDERQLEIGVPAEAQPSSPYFLKQPLQGSLYDWSTTPEETRGAPFEPPALSLIYRFRIDGIPVTLKREVVHRHRDQAFGEVRKPLRIVPKLEISVDPPQVVWPIGTKYLRLLKVQVQSNTDTPINAQVEVQGPQGWPNTPPVTFNITQPQGHRLLEIPLQVPADVAPGQYTVNLSVVDEDGQRFHQSYPLIDYEHVRPTPMPTAAQVRVSADHMRWPSLQKIGYVRGASDRVPEFLLEVGLPIWILNNTNLENDDLSQFDAVVIGSRAYEVNPTLVKANNRLLDYTRQGGLLIVQYQQYQFVRGGFTPYPLEIHRPHDRVTDETAAVRILAPQHPIFTHPNPLNAADWQGWVQERGLYFAGTWDNAYQPLLAMADPGGEEKSGGLLVASYGQGTYIYTGLALFRQLPAGVTGAYRLFANMLALAEKAEGGS